MTTTKYSTSILISPISGSSRPVEKQAVEIVLRMGILLLQKKYKLGEICMALSSHPLLLLGLGPLGANLVIFSLAHSPSQGTQTILGRFFL